VYRRHQTALFLEFTHTLQVFAACLLVGVAFLEPLVDVESSQLCKPARLETVTIVPVFIFSNTWAF
jgi:hypothetical protein